MHNSITFLINIHHHSNDLYKLKQVRFFVN